LRDLRALRKELEGRGALKVVVKDQTDPSKKRNKTSDSPRYINLEISSADADRVGKIAEELISRFQ
jgi:hypothetical protein